MRDDLGLPEGRSRGEFSGDLGDFPPSVAFRAAARASDASCCRRASAACTFRAGSTYDDAISDMCHETTGYSNVNADTLPCLW